VKYVITKPRAARSANPLRVAHGILLVLATIGVLHATALVVVTLYRDHAWNQQAADTRQRIHQLQREVNQLTTRRAKASTDERYLEELARRQGFVKKTETVTVPIQPGR
jgi:cell division protein FtsB